MNCRGLFDSDDNEIETDLVVKIEGTPYTYHTEAQTAKDTNIEERFYEYGTTIVHKYFKHKDGSRLIQILVQIEGESAEISFEVDGSTKRVHVLNLKNLSMKELLDSGYYLLIPFYPCRYRNELTESKICDTIKEDIKNAFKDAYNALYLIYMLRMKNLLKLLLK